MHFLILKYCSNEIYVYIGEDEKCHSNFKPGFNQVFHSSQNNKGGVHNRDKAQPAINNSVTENIYAGNYLK